MQLQDYELLGNLLLGNNIYEPLDGSIIQNQEISIIQ